MLEICGNCAWRKWWCLNFCLPHGSSLVQGYRVQTVSCFTFTKRATWCIYFPHKRGIHICKKKHHRNVSRFHNWWCSLNRLYTSLASWPLEVSYKEMLQKWCLLVQSPIFDTECFGLMTRWPLSYSKVNILHDLKPGDLWFFSKFTSWIDLWRGFLCAMSARLALHRVGDQPMIAANHRLCCCIRAQHEFILTVDPLGSKTKLVMV